jgi:hypothetical protein
MYGVVVDVHIGMRLAEMNLVIFDGVSGEPIQRNGALPGDDLADIAAARFHVAGRAKDDVVSGRSKRPQFLDRAEHRLKLGVLLPRPTQLAHHSIEINADSHGTIERI